MDVWRAAWLYYTNTGRSDGNEASTEPAILVIITPGVMSGNLLSRLPLTSPYQEN